MKYLVVTFVTKNTPYENVFREYLGKSLSHHPTVPYCVYALESQGSWVKNVALKPHTILMAMRQYPDHNIVFLDADATIEREPVLFDELGTQDVELAYHLLDWNTWYGHTDAEPKRELLSGTMFFRNCERVRELCVRWYQDATAHNQWEQKALQAILHRERGAYKIAELPLSYCYIKTLPDGRPPLVAVDAPVIVHHQVSRQLKHLITP